METAHFIAIGFAMVIIVLAIVLTRLFAGSKRPRYDINGSKRDGDAIATWAGIRGAGKDDGFSSD